MLNHFGRTFFSGRRRTTVNTSNPIVKYVAKVERKHMTAEVKARKYDVKA